MKLSRKWLNDFVDIRHIGQGFASRMTMSGSIVEGYSNPGTEITNVVVGKVLRLNSIPMLIDCMFALLMLEKRPCYNSHRCKQCRKRKHCPRRN